MFFFAAFAEKIADIGFIVDDSSSITYIDKDAWQRDVLGFITALVRQFTISQAYVRVGVVTFSNDAQLHFTFDRYTNASTLLPAIRGLECPNITHTATNIAAGLRKARTDLFNSTFRRNSQKISILVTDGAASREEASTLTEATRLKRDGVEIFTMGVGRADREELKQIASSPDESHNYYVSDTDARYNYARLDTVVDTLARVIYEFAVSTTSRMSSTTPYASVAGMVSTLSGSLGSSVSILSESIPASSVSSSPGSIHVSTPFRSLSGSMVSTPSERSFHGSSVSSPFGSLPGSRGSSPPGSPPDLISSSTEIHTRPVSTVSVVSTSARGNTSSPPPGK